MKAEFEILKIMKEMQFEIVKLTQEVKDTKQKVATLVKQQNIATAVAQAQAQTGEWIPLIQFAEMKKVLPACIRHRFYTGFYPQEWWKKEGKLVYIFSNE